MSTTRDRGVLLGLAALLTAVALVASAFAAGPGSEKISRNLCETTGGAKIVPIPGFPGERVDRRLLDDIRLLQRRYKIFITDGYSNDPVHASNGEHPMGLALDIVPDKAAGGSWRDITALAKWAEPVQNEPMAPFRWVGYDGDAGHGRGNHLHLSWNHSEVRAGRSPKTVYTLRCPGGKAPPASGGGPGGEAPQSGGDKGGKGGNGPSGGIEPTGGTGGTSGGVSAGRQATGLLRADPSAPVVETGGVGLGD